jgi:hypothetical protein
MSTTHLVNTNWRVARTAGAKREEGRRTTRVRRRDDETGALLILAIVFLTVISVIATSLTLWATNGLNDTTKFASALSLESATNSAAQLALQDVRYNFTPTTLNQSPPQPCWMPPPGATFNAQVAQQQFNGEWVSAWCSTQWNPLSAASRVVTISACLNPSNTYFPNGTLVTDPIVQAAATACAQNPFLQTVVQYDDYPTTIGASNCSPLGSTTCGTTFTVLSWAFGVTVPMVASVGESANSSCASNEEIDITGSQLTGATSVNVIASSANNVVFTASPLSGGTDGSVSACAPSQMKSGTTYQISVTTPSATSTTTSLLFH